MQIVSLLTIGLFSSRSHAKQAMYIRGRNLPVSRKMQKATIENCKQGFCLNNKCQECGESKDGACAVCWVKGPTGYSCDDCIPLWKELASSKTAPAPGPSSDTTLSLLASGHGSLNETQKLVAAFSVIASAFTIAVSIYTFRQWYRQRRTERQTKATDSDCSEDKTDKTTRNPAVSSEASSSSDIAVGELITEKLSAQIEPRYDRKTKAALSADPYHGIPLAGVVSTV